MQKTVIKKVLLVMASLGLLLSGVCLAPAPARAGLIQPTDLVYLGAFRLPEGSNDTDWTYGGNALTYYPQGDPGGSGDGYSGSLFGTGNDGQLYVSEISIPAPVVSAGKNLGDLNTAVTLQPFTDIFTGLFGYIEQPRLGMCYLPAQAGQSSGKIHFCFGLHLQDTGFDASHGWFNTDLGNPQTAGVWVFGGYTGYVTNDYMCEIPREWADAHTPGQYLATGRAREGPWSGYGPGLFAYAPWNDGSPPAPGSTLSSFTTLMLYGTQIPGVPELGLDGVQAIPDYSNSDRWRGCAWLSAGGNSAVVFSGTKALGNSWYGFADGTVWHHDCAETNSCPDVPDWPYDNRGFWADNFQAQLIFFNPDDLAAVASGAAASWSPMPYAVMDLSPYFFDPLYTVDDLINYKRDFVGAITFDREHGLLFVLELIVDDSKPIVHVFRVG